MPLRSITSQYHGPATVKHETAAIHHPRQRWRRKQKPGTARASGTKPLASAAKPKQIPMAAKRGNWQLTESGRTSGKARNTASEKNTASGKSVSPKLLYVSHPADVASSAVEIAAAWPQIPAV